MNKYQFNLIWSNQDNEYMVTCPEFPGLSAFGETAEEALAEAQIALELFIETYQEDGVPLPEPQTVPEYSGQIRLRLPKSLHAQAAKLAANDEISLNQFICNAVQARVSGQQVGNALISLIQREKVFGTIERKNFSAGKLEIKREISGLMLKGRSTDELPSRSKKSFTEILADIEEESNLTANPALLNPNPKIKAGKSGSKKTK